MNHNAYVVGCILLAGDGIPLFSVFSEETPTLPASVVWTQLEVSAEEYQDAKLEATRRMDADCHFVRVPSSPSRPTWKVATYEQYRAGLRAVEVSR